MKASPDGGAFSALAIFQQGNALASQGRLEQAAECYRQALRIEPRLVEAQSNLGAALKLLGRFDEAEAALHAALAARPDFVDAWLNLGGALEAQARPADALEAFLQAARLAPQNPAPWLSAANVQLALGKYADAEAGARRALACGTPQPAQAYTNLGAALHHQGRLAEAEAAYRQALAADPAFAVAHANLGTLLETLRRYDEAVTEQARALELDPSNPERRFNLGNALLARGRLREAEAAYREALALRPDHARACSNLLLSLEYRSDLSPEDLFREHLAYDAVVRHAPAPPHANRPDPERRLRVGYVSADFRGHSVSCFLAHVLEAHDRGPLEVFCYSNSRQADAITARIRAASDGWRETYALADDDVAELIRQDGIDVLVDLAGHTGDNRLPLFALKPAPVQVTWLGYPDTTGLREIDYRITDAWADPPGRSDELHTEKLVRLPHGFSAYEPQADAPEVAPLPAEANGYLTFGSFNNFNKLTQECLEVWARILAAVPTARLLLKCGQFDDPVICEEILARLPSVRLELVGAQARPSEHLAQYARVDVALDPFPYNGATTTCEALCMGVPVIALAGNRHAARVGLSMLSRVGLADLVAVSQDEYVDRAVELAGDLPRLRRLRASLRDMLRASPLTDGRRLARELEAAYRDMWRAWCGGRSL
jgi:protein O-GlcNAc transferase